MFETQDKHLKYHCSCNLFTLVHRKAMLKKYLTWMAFGLLNWNELCMYFLTCAMAVIVLYPKALSNLAVAAYWFLHFKTYALNESQVYVVNPIKSKLLLQIWLLYKSN